MVDKCNSCDQMKKENTQTRKALLETSKQYVDVINDNLAMKKRLEEISKIQQEWWNGDVETNVALSEIRIALYTDYIIADHK